MLKENHDRKKDMEHKEKEIEQIRIRANDQEQYIRSWSIRILDLELPFGKDKSDPWVVMQHVFDVVLMPILEGAVKEKLLTKIPEMQSIIETAHILPSNNSNSKPPIILRFYSRNIKALFFRLKKVYATRRDDGQAGQAGQDGASLL